MNFETERDRVYILYIIREADAETEQSRRQQISE